MGTGPANNVSPTFQQLEQNTFVAYGDLDASPTKAWIYEHRKDDGMQKYFDFAFGRRPMEELYDLRKDPHQMTNLAGNQDYQRVQTALRERLFTELRQTGDPRVTGDGTTFEKPPYTNPNRPRQKKKKRKKE